MFFGMWLVWILGGLGVFLFGGLLGIGDWAYFFLATGLLAGASAAVNRILERLRDLDKRLQQLQAQLDRLTQGLSSEEPDEPGGFDPQGRTLCARRFKGQLREIRAHTVRPCKRECRVTHTWGRKNARIP